MKLHQQIFEIGLLTAVIVPHLCKKCYSYHQYKEMKAYLEEINRDQEKNEWSLICILFAPNAPPAESNRGYLAKCQDFGEKIWESSAFFFLG